MTNVHKEYYRGFLLEPTKLGRLVDKIHERLGDHQDKKLHEMFEVFFTGNRREEMTSLEQVLALDNSPKQKITRLVVTCSTSSPGTARPEHEVQVDFGRFQAGGTGTTSKIVAASVRSEAAGWASRTLSEVEEQIERNWLQYAQPVIVLVGLLVVTVVLLASQFLSVRVPLDKDWWLTASDMDRIEIMLAKHPILTDDDLREVSTTQLRNVLAGRGKTTPDPASPKRRRLFLAIALSVVAVCAVTLLVTCYPTAVFLWGDEVDRYARILQRRKAMWSIIVGVAVVGIASNLLFDAAQSWFPRT